MSKEMKELEKIARQLSIIDSRTLSERAERSFKVSKIISNEWHGYPANVLYFWEEAKSCYIYGQLFASIIMSALVMEESLRATYRNMGETRFSKLATFDKLTQRAIDDEIIGDDDEPILDAVRRVRNRIVHTKTIDIRAEPLRDLLKQKPEAMQGDLHQYWENTAYRAFAISTMLSTELAW